ncbi:hypothetical protein GCM10009754_28510 [Amycolatopsis minnesotensis]|uniref:DDE Tnp4 domain-containing protein n=1 Tax=Amycolatopsis minnesotensis TaxID=337894 RepID=A0ABN2QQX4_9PSEU
MNLQVIASPDGTILWVSGDLPGSTHDTAAARIWQILAALRDAGLIALDDKGYHGYDEAGQHVITPYKGKNKPESQRDANRAHARPRGPGERANAQLKPGTSYANSAAAPDAPANSPKPSTSYKTTRSPQDEKHSMYPTAPKADDACSNPPGWSCTYCPRSRYTNCAMTIVVNLVERFSPRRRCSGLLAADGVSGRAMSSRRVKVPVPGVYQRAPMSTAPVSGSV